MRTIVLATTMVFVFAGCSPEVGSEKWCPNMKEKLSDEWTI